MARATTDQRGVTLAEILVAAAVVAVGLAGLAAAVPLASYGIQEGSQLSTATFLATQRLEQVRRAPWTATPQRDALGVSPSSGAGPEAAGTTTFPDEAPMAPPYGQYTRRVRVVDCGQGSGCQGAVSPDLRQVTVTVTYRPLSGLGQAPATKSAAVTMLIARR